MSLNTQRLIDAGFTDDDMSVIMATFSSTIKAMVSSLDELRQNEDFPLNDEETQSALASAIRVVSRIDAYNRSNQTDQFSMWINSFKKGEQS